MSVVSQAMFRDLLDTFSRKRATAHGAIPSLIKASLPSFNMVPVTYTKKRSYSDHANDSAFEAEADAAATKRLKTAPPLESPPKITLPNISEALKAIHAPPRQKIVPTVLLDYFDTYKPNDEHWRYGLLDLIRTRPSAALSMSYLHKHAAAAPSGFSSTSSTSTATSTKLPSYLELSKIAERPHFDARVGHQALPTLAEKKINFPFESNYTYLNKTYMTDVERYPEYMELAQSLVALSRPQGSAAAAKHSDDSRGSLNGYSAYQPHTIQTQPSHPRVLSRDVYSHETRLQEPALPHTLAARSPLPLPSINHLYPTPDTSFEAKTPTSPTVTKKKASFSSATSTTQRTRFIPITPPSVKDKSRLELMKSPPRHVLSGIRVCISCGLDQLPCWRPSWSAKEGQLCNSCGLRYKKTAARCLNNECRKIPAKGEWSLMQMKGMTKFEDGDEAYGCLDCKGKVEVKR